MMLEKQTNASIPNIAPFKWKVPFHFDLLLIDRLSTYCLGIGAFCWHPIGVFCLHPKKMQVTYPVGQYKWHAQRAPPKLAVLEPSATSLTLSPCIHRLGPQLPLIVARALDKPSDV